MSIELLLVPLVIAALGAAKAKVEGETSQGLGADGVRVTSRLKDGGLVAAALGDLGAVLFRTESDAIEGSVGGKPFTFTRNEEGLWAARFAEAWGQEGAVDLVTRLDTAYGLRVQQEVLRKIRARAPGAGMTIASETVDEDETVTLTLNVGSA